MFSLSRVTEIKPTEIPWSGFLPLFWMCGNMQRLPELSFSLSALPEFVLHLLFSCSLPSEPRVFLKPYFFLAPLCNPHYVPLFLPLNIYKQYQWPTWVAPSFQQSGITTTLLLPLYFSHQIIKYSKVIVYFTSIIL